MKIFPRTIWNVVLCLVLASPCVAQVRTRQNLAAILGFENGTVGPFPAGWSGADAFIDDQVFHGGKFSARIERTSASANTFSTILVSTPMDFAGKTLEWRGFVKSENTTEPVALWFREDGDAGSLGFATTQGLGVKGTNDWQEYSITLPVVSEAKTVVVGFLMGGTGKAWVDDLQLLVDGKPVAEAPGREPTILEKDTEFDGNSKIQITALSDVQVANLAKLAKVWGFAKYHHPAITAGTRHWDYDLFRVMPKVLEATDASSANTAISAWLASLGTVPDCSRCASLDESDLYLAPNLDWINDEAGLGVELSQMLRSIYRNRTVLSKQFFVSLATGVLNPVFENELTYGAVRFPDAGYQLLALFRFWNMVAYFYPNRDVIADDGVDPIEYWNKVLDDAIPAVGLAKTSLTYQQEMMKFIAKINDTHANLWSSLAARPPIGTCQLPVDVRFVEGKAIVLRHISPTAGPASGLLPGDVIEQLDGVAVDDLVTQWRPIYADSNEAARFRDIGNSMTRGACGAANVMVTRDEEQKEISSNRVAGNTLNFSATSVHDRPGATFQKLSDAVAYLKLSSVQIAESANYIRQAAGTKGLIIDIRNYPSEFVVFSLGSLLVSERADFVQFTNGDMTNPGAFHWGPVASLFPAQPHYSGKVVILIDEVTQSQAEYTTMAFRNAPGAIVIGSTTAGADGNVSIVPLPGGLSSYISGIGVFYPDHRPTQRVGIIPDIEVRPTIAGIRAGRDELLEEAVRQITGQ